MRQFTLSLSALLLLSSAWLRADFRYEQTSQMTGGALMDTLKNIPFTGKLREPMKSTVVVKGGRMLNRSADSAQLIDVDAETITEINYAKKTYSVVTFAQMKEAMERAWQDAQKQKGKDAPSAEMNMKFSVDQKDRRRKIGAYDTRLTVLTLEMESKDNKTGQSATISMVNDMWLAPRVDGYDEVQAFYKRYAEKLAWSPNSSMFAAVAAMGGASPADVNKSMAEMAREASKMEGVAIQQISRMNLGGAGAPPPTQKSASSRSSSAGTPSVSEAIGGALGGFGGFGRRKKPAATPAPDETVVSTQNDPAEQGPQAFMEITITVDAFSNAPVDSSELEVPAGFKRTDSDLLKAYGRK